MNASVKMSIASIRILDVLKTYVSIKKGTNQSVTKACIN